LRIVRISALTCLNLSLRQSDRVLKARTKETTDARVQTAITCERGVPRTIKSDRGTSDQT